MNFYNLIILDRSGSMTSIRNEAVAGVNETLGTIKAYARQHRETSQHVSLLTFCGCTKKYVYDNQPIKEIAEFTRDMYHPCCSTPLYDAIGMSCSKLLALTAGDPQARVSVTIITDGYENASEEWNHAGIAKLIADLKSRGWLFAYIGAEHDVEKVALSININNTLQFSRNEESTRAMFERECKSRSRWMDKARECKDMGAMPCANEGYFDE
ncbi:MAG: VWA domain-containing protein [Clostridiales bacterium]|nr:VWA domain-containing protein [Clostridiales bacterium]